MNNFLFLEFAVFVFFCFQKFILTSDEYATEGKEETEKELKLLSSYYARHADHWLDREDWKARFLELRRKFAAIEIPSRLLDVPYDAMSGSSQLCVICMSESRKLMCRPCNHFCLCAECAKELGKRGEQLCPMCRREVRSLEEVFA